MRAVFRKKKAGMLRAESSWPHRPKLAFAPAALHRIHPARVLQHGSPVRSNKREPRSSGERQPLVPRASANRAFCLLSRQGRGILFKVTAVGERKFLVALIVN